MMKIDGQQAGNIQSFASIALHTAVQTGQVTLTVRGKPVKTAGLTPLRKLFKQELYRTSSLPKRLSDDDFLSDQHMLEFNIDGGALGAAAQLGIDKKGLQSWMKMPRKLLYLSRSTLTRRGCLRCPSSAIPISPCSSTT